jgi:TolA-binding protein
MKSIERHRIKEDQFVTTLHDTFERIEQNRKQLLTGIVAVVVLAAAVGGFMWWRQQTQAKASALLGEAMTTAEAPVTPPAPPPGSTLNESESPAPAANSYPTEKARAEAARPKFMAAAEAYPSTLPGLAARYHAAATLVALGRDADAEQRYREVIDMGGSGLYGRMARLGLAEVQVRQKKYEPAINTLKDLSTSAKDELPLDGVLMQLGRTYALAGRKAEAVQTFQRLTTEFPTSAYAGDAKKELDTLKGGAP